MKEHFYPTEAYDREHRHFGGLIYSSDFNTDVRGKDHMYGSPIAARIQSDQRRESRLTESSIRSGAGQERR